MLKTLFTPAECYSKSPTHSIRGTNLKLFLFQKCTTTLAQLPAIFDTSHFNSTKIFTLPSIIQSHIHIEGEEGGSCKYLVDMLIDIGHSADCETVMPCHTCPGALALPQSHMSASHWFWTGFLTGGEPGTNPMSPLIRGATRAQP